MKDLELQKKKNEKKGKHFVDQETAIVLELCSLDQRAIIIKKNR